MVYFSLINNSVQMSKKLVGAVTADFVLKRSALILDVL